MFASTSSASLARRLARAAACVGLGLALLPLPSLSADAALDAQFDVLEKLAAHEPAQAQRALDGLALPDDGLDERAAVRVALVRAMIADSQYRSDEVLRRYAQVRERALHLDDARVLAVFDQLLASADYQIGHFEEGWQALDDARRQAERAGDDDLLAVVMAARVRYCVRGGDYQAAAAAVADAERHARGAQASAEVAFADSLLAKNVGDWDLDLRANQDAHRRFEQLGDRTGIADSLAGAGDALNRLGRAGEAIESLQGAKRIYREIGDRDGEAIATEALAQADDQLGRNGSAMAEISEAIAILEKENEPWQLAQARVFRAALLVRERQAAAALALLRKARPVVLEQSELAARARLHEVLAQALAALGRGAEAYEEMRQAQLASDRRTEQLVARQLAAQRGRLESDRLARENALLHAQAQSGEQALEEARRAQQFQQIALALGTLVVVGALLALWRQRVLLRRIERLAQTDSLTGVLNRRTFLELGGRAINRCRRAGQPCALLMLDVDRFKDINDRHGHAVGDRALRDVSMALQTGLRPGDLIGRYGGEEFTLILPGAQAVEARQVAERLRTAVGALRTEWAPESAGGLTISGGIAVANAGGRSEEELDALLARADRALYRAKDGGRNRMELEDLAAAAAPA
jgi:diguanylate cyclase (GGDEF)-like protein